MEQHDFPQRSAEATAATAGAEAAGGAHAVGPDGSVFRSLAALRRDLDHYRQVSPGSSDLRLLLSEQGLWAIVEYRLATAAAAAPLPRFLKRALLAVFSVWHKVVEITTGIELAREAHIGSGFYIGHFGGIVIHPDTRIGQHCAIMQGVTVGLSWGKNGHGAPVIGDNVYIGPKATVVGPITVGNGAVVSANSLVTRDVAPGVLVRGVPAEPVRAVVPPAQSDNPVGIAAGAVGRELQR